MKIGVFRGRYTLLVTSHNILKFLYINVIDFPGQDPGLIILRIIKTYGFPVFVCLFVLRGVYCCFMVTKENQEKPFFKKISLGSLEFLPRESQGGGRSLVGCRLWE